MYGLCLQGPHSVVGITGKQIQYNSIIAIVEISAKLRRWDRGRRNQLWLSESI